MELRPDPWIEALRHSHGRLGTLVATLDPAQIEGPAYPSEWSVGQVLSHLGSGAEIFGLFLEAGLSGQEPPGPETFGAIWGVWNAYGPAELTTEALRADKALVERFESLDQAQQAALRLSMFGMDVDLTRLVSMRLGEHAVHSWDIAVALDPAATLGQDAVDLMVDSVPDLAAHAGKPGPEPLRILVTTTGPERHLVLDAQDSVRIGEPADDQDLPELTLPAEAFVRLVYGRMDPDHTPAVSAGGIDLDQVRALFPGF